jgi:hypothetical protein
VLAAGCGVTQAVAFCHAGADYLDRQAPAQYLAATSQQRQAGQRGGSAQKVAARYLHG